MRHLLWAAVLAFCAPPSWAQDAATLVADRVEIQGDNVLVAEGAVEVLQKGMTLTASRVTFDAANDSLSIEGPIVLIDASGARILADQAELSADLQNGILTGARLVLQQQLQLAAAEIQRVGGRYTELGRTVASSCQVCAANPVPIWEIRAQSVVHDQLEQQMYFTGAQLRFFGVPVFYIPRLRMPDPGLDRATGFLRPDYRITNQLGYGIIQPYFIAINPSSDLTLAPYISSKQGRSLGLRYRQALDTGQFEVNGALSSDEILPDELRGYLFASGAFSLPRDFTLTFGIQAVSDNGYLIDYGISEQDYLDSFVEIQRVMRDDFVLGRIHYYDSLRESEDPTRPSSLIDLVEIQRFTLPGLGGGQPALPAVQREPRFVQRTGRQWGRHFGWAGYGTGPCGAGLDPGLVPAGRPGRDGAGAGPGRCHGGQSGPQLSVADRPALQCRGRQAELAAAARRTGRLGPGAGTRGPGAALAELQPGCPQ